MLYQRVNETNHGHIINADYEPDPEVTKDAELGAAVRAKLARFYDGDGTMPDCLRESAKYVVEAEVGLLLEAIADVLEKEATDAVPDEAQGIIL